MTISALVLLASLAHADDLRDLRIEDIHVSVDGGNLKVDGMAVEATVQNGRLVRLIDNMLERFEGSTTLVNKRVPEALLVTVCGGTSEDHLWLSTVRTLTDIQHVYVNTDCSGSAEPDGPTKP